MVILSKLKPFLALDNIVSKGLFQLGFVAGILQGISPQIYVVSFDHRI